jgi:hypothetical protein
VCAAVRKGRRREGSGRTPGRFEGPAAYGAPGGQGDNIAGHAPSIMRTQRAAFEGGGLRGCGVVGRRGAAQMHAPRLEAGAGSNKRRLCLGIRPEGGNGWPATGGSHMGRAAAGPRRARARARGAFSNPGAAARLRRSAQTRPGPRQAALPPRPPALSRRRPAAARDECRGRTDAHSQGPPPPPPPLAPRQRRSKAHAARQNAAAAAARRGPMVLRIPQLTGRRPPARHNGLRPSPRGAGPGSAGSSIRGRAVAPAGGVHVACALASRVPAGARLPPASPGAPGAAAGGRLKGGPGRRSAASRGAHRRLSE